YKEDPSEDNLELLKRTTLGRAQQLKGQGYARDAVTVLENGIDLDTDSQWLESIALELAACGAAQRALQVLQTLPDSPAVTRILTVAADEAMRRGKDGRNLLPEELRPSFDLIIQAFSQTEAGQDEQAKATLQDIGLSSPFLEWKLLHRGFAAYYQNDDGRAAENWRRLKEDRLPFRLAAPFLCRLDPAFRAAQTADSQNTLGRQYQRLQGSAVTEPLRILQRALGAEHQLSQSFRQAENLLPHFRREFPDLVPRLAACFYWAIVDHGAPEDMTRYKRVFGTPSDDPELNRLEALALDHRHSLDGSHQAWQAYIQDVANNPTAWPGDQNAKVRALIWHHMGDNAASVPDDQELKRLPPHLRDHPDRPRPLKPSAEICYQNALECAPDYLVTYEALFHLHLRKNRPGKAEKIAHKLLDRFPEHVPTLEALGDLLHEKQRYGDALIFYQRAMKANPLERRFRSKVRTGHTYVARSLAEAGRF